MSSKLMIVDGNSIINRAYYGLPHLTAPDGTPTGAIYGFLNILFKFLDEEKPDKITIAFDRSEPTFRHEYYSEYKGTRKPTDPELREQIYIMKDVLRAMNIENVSLVGYEADDIIGTYSKRFAKEGGDVVIVSGDKDLLQLVDDKICMKNPKTKMGRTIVDTYYPEDIYEEFGVTPTEFIDLKALMGDSSDNIPGVPGVGPKTAMPLIQEYHDVETVIENIPNVKAAGLRKKLENNIDNIRLSKYLAKINIDVPVEYNPTDVDMDKIINENTMAYFKRFNFKTLIKRFGNGKTERNNQNDEFEPVAENNPFEDVSDDPNQIIKITNLAEIKFIDSSDEFENIIDKVKENIADGKNSSISIRTEKDDDRSLILAISIDCQDAYVAKGPFISSVAIADAVKKILDYSVSQQGKIYAFDIKNIMLRLNIIDEFPIENVFDVSLAAYLLNPTESNYSYFDVASDYTDAILDDEKKLKNEPEKVCALEAWTAINTGDKLFRRLETNNVDKIYREIEAPLSIVLADMTTSGVSIKKEELREFSAFLNEKICELENKIIEEAGIEFNINSPKQLSEVFFEKMKLPHGKKTKTGYSTAADVLEKLAEEYDIAADVLTYRTLTKLKSTYADGLVSYIESDGKIHGDFNQTVTATGRISSTNPNLQNIPIREKIGRQIRKAFVPSEGNVFIDADYSQIELRILAHMSGDEKLIEAYNVAEDVHAITASQVFHLPLEEVTPELRRAAKAVNFGIIYGISSFGLGKGLSISVKEAKEYIDRYFETYPSIKQFLDGLVAKAKEKGYSETMFGRIRPIPEIFSKNHNVRSFGERVAMNAPIQGSAADIIKIAMITVYKKLKEEKLKSKLILQVHDELLVDTVPEEEDKVKKIITDSMVHAADLKVPLSIDINTGENWLEAH